MRHLKRTAKLGRTSEHRNAMLANLVCSLIKHKRITTTLAKAKAARPVAEKMITLGKEGTLHARRLAAARLRARGRSLEQTKEQRKKWREDEDVVRILFEDLAPVFKERRGGYTRIIHLGGVEGRYAGQRRGDAAKCAILEWVELPAGSSAVPAAEAKPAEAKQVAETTKA
jgi:large subunit ribosomal protein L17